MRKIYDYLTSFKNYPVNIEELRSDKTGRASDQSKRTMMLKHLRDCDNDNLKQPIATIIIDLYSDGHSGREISCTKGITRHQIAGVLLDKAVSLVTDN